MPRAPLCPGAGGRELCEGQWQESQSKHNPFLHNLQQSCSGSPVVILQDVQTAPKASPSGRHKPKTTRLITKDFIRDLM